MAAASSMREEACLLTNLSRAPPPATSNSTLLPGVMPKGCRLRFGIVSWLLLVADTAIGNSSVILGKNSTKTVQRKGRQGSSHVLRIRSSRWRQGSPPVRPSTPERRTNNPQVVADKFLRGKQKRRRKGRRFVQYVAYFGHSFEPTLVDAIAEREIL